MQPAKKGGGDMNSGTPTIAKRPTIDDVAQLAGVSIKTVSRVFNREPNVRGETRYRVVDAAETLKYHPNPSARQLASNRRFLVGMLYDTPNPDSENDYVTRRRGGAQSEHRYRNRYGRPAFFVPIRSQKRYASNRHQYAEFRKPASTGCPALV